VPSTNQGNSPDRGRQAALRCDDHLMREAFDAMREGFDHAAGLRPFGAVVARAGVVIAKATNTCGRDCDPTAHAEINAIRMAKASLPLFGTDWDGLLHLPLEQVRQRLQITPVTEGRYSWHSQGRLAHLAA